MSEEPGSGGAPGGYQGEAPSGGQVLVGVVLILFGLCLLLVGGGCTAMWLFVMFSGSSWGGSDGAGLLIVSIAVAAGGVFGIVQGVKMLRWRTRVLPAAAAPAEPVPDDPPAP